MGSNGEWLWIKMKPEYIYIYISVHSEGARFCSKERIADGLESCTKNNDLY